MMALEADRLSFSYGEVPVLSCASFGLPQGGFAGPYWPKRRREKHAVKTAAGGALPQQRRRAAAGPGYGPVSELEKAGLCAPGRAGPPYRFSRLRGGGRSGQPVRDIGLFRFPRQEHRERVRQALELVGMAGYGRRLIGALSGGQRQRVLLARALIPPGGHAAGLSPPPAWTCKAGRTFTACWPG